MDDKRNIVCGPDGKNPLTHPSVVAGLPELTEEEKEALSDTQLYLHSLKTIVKLEQRLAKLEAAASNVEKALRFQNYEFKNRGFDQTAALLLDLAEELGSALAGSSPDEGSDSITQIGEKNADAS